MSGRPEIVGDNAGPTDPFPHRMEGTVIAGFGRGSSELGIPTANLPVDESKTPWIAKATSGVYFGYASLLLPSAHKDRPAQTPSTSTSTSSTSPNQSFTIFPMVMSIGYNPFYKNTVRSAEVHVLHNFTENFYEAHMRLLILGFIREEKDYSSMEALVEDINFDCTVARNSLKRDGWAPGMGLVVGQHVAGGLDVAYLLQPLEVAS